MEAIPGRQTTTPVYDLEFKPDNSNIVFLARDAGIIQYATHFSSDSLVCTKPFIFTDRIRANHQCCTSLPNEASCFSCTTQSLDCCCRGTGYNDRFWRTLYTKSMTANANGTLNTSGATIAMRASAAAKLIPYGQVVLGRGYGDVIIDKTNSLNIMVAGLGFYTSSQGLSSNPVHWTWKDYNCGNNTVNFHVDVSNMYEYNGSIYVCNDGGVARQLKLFLAQILPGRILPNLLRLPRLML